MGIRGLSPPPRHERLGSPRWRTRAFSVCVLVSCLPPCVGLKTEEEQSREPTQPARRPHASASTYVLSIPTYVHFNRLEQLFDPVNTLLLARSPVLAGGPSFFWSADTPIGQPEMRPRIHDGPTAAWGRQTISQPPATRRGGTPRTPFTGPLAQRTGRARPRRPTSHTSAPFAAAERVLRAHPIGLAGTNRAAAARGWGGWGGAWWPTQHGRNTSWQLTQKPWKGGRASTQPRGWCACVARLGKRLVRKRGVGRGRRGGRVSLVLVLEPLRAVTPWPVPLRPPPSRPLHQRPCLCRRGTTPPIAFTGVPV